MGAESGPLQSLRPGLEKQLVMVDLMANPAQSPPRETATVHHRSARQRRAAARRKGTGGGSRGGVGELNLTSMIDVIFQLLIYFVVTAGFMIDEGVLAAKLPQGPAGPVAADELPPEKVTIRLTPDATDDSLVQIERGPVDRPIRYAGFRELAEDLDRLRLDDDAPSGTGGGGGRWGRWGRWGGL